MENNPIAIKAKTTPKDFFLHLLAIVALYTSAVSFSIIIFQYINLYFPDALESNYYYYGRGIMSLIRNSLATLIVFFPVYIFSTRYLGKDYNQNPDKKELRIRKWLIYFTLFAAALIIMGDLVALIRSFLEGELTARFLLKVLTIGFVAGSVFSYYFSELKDKSQKALTYIVVGAVAIAIVAGFFIAGSPNEERARRFDDQRIQNLGFIQGEVVFYWQSKGSLPENLEVLNDDLRGVFIPLDPETETPYSYRIIDNLSFELCASFNLASDENSAVPDVYYDDLRKPGQISTSEDAWSHTNGQNCFERTIDPDIYKKPLP